jgi:hypothetical protein
MASRFAADAVLVAHFAFIAFVVAGGFAVWKRAWLMMLHLPAVLWASFIVASGGICPLTYVENALRARAGQQGYGESFIEHYLLHIIYPPGLTPGVQIALAAIVVILNVAVYARLLSRRRRPFVPNPSH